MPSYAKIIDELDKYTHIAQTFQKDNKQLINSNSLIQQEINKLNHSNEEYSKSIAQPVLFEEMIQQPKTSSFSNNSLFLFPSIINNKLKSSAINQSSSKRKTNSDYDESQKKQRMVADR